MSHLTWVFCWKKTRLTHAIKASLRANSYNFKTCVLIYLQLLFLSFPDWAHLFFLPQSSMKINNTFRRITKGFWRENRRDSHWIWFVCRTSTFFFQKFTSIFFLARTLINRCQIATGRSVFGKTVPEVLTGTVFSRRGPPGWRITYIYSSIHPITPLNCQITVLSMKIKRYLIFLLFVK